VTAPVVIHLGRDVQVLEVGVRRRPGKPLRYVTLRVEGLPDPLELELAVEEWRRVLDATPVAGGWRLDLALIAPEPR
jgi:hypothetical protein